MRSISIRASSASAGDFSRGSPIWSFAARWACGVQAVDRNFTKGFADGERGKEDQRRVLYRRLAVLDGFAVDGIADHFDEGSDIRIFRDEAVIPALVRWADQHQLKPALPYDPAAEPSKHRPAVAAVSRIGFRAAGASPVRIGGAIVEPHQIEHVDGAFAMIVAKLCEDFLRRIDMAFHNVSHRGRCQPAAS